MATHKTPLEAGLTIGRLARMADVSANAVRFYEREGLMRAPSKTAAGYRIYGPESVEWLRFIKQAQRCGFTLSEVQELLRVRAEPQSCCGDVRSKLVEKKIELAARMKEMKAMSAGIDRMLAECADAAAPVDNCSILSELARAGGGVP